MKKDLRITFDVISGSLLVDEKAAVWPEDFVKMTVEDLLHPSDAPQPIELTDNEVRLFRAFVENLTGK